MCFFSEIHILKKRVFFSEIIHTLKIVSHPFEETSCLI